MKKIINTMFGFALVMATFFAPIADAATATTNQATNIGQTTATLNGYADTQGVSSIMWYEWGTSTSFGRATATLTGNGANNIVNDIYNLNPATTYYYRLVVQSAGQRVDGNTVSFTTTGTTNTTNTTTNTTQAATVTTSGATNVSSSYATLNSYVDTKGVSSTIWYEWGTSTSLGNKTTSFSANGSNNVVNDLFNLNSNTTYYYRLVAQNNNGTVNGNIVSFTTTGTTNTTNTNTNTTQAATVTTNAATNVGQATATLNGFADTKGVSSTIWYEWGTSTSLGNKTVTVTATGANNVVNDIFNLNSNTTYYYRLVVQNGAGTVQGNIVSFTTQFSGSSNNNNTNQSPLVTTNGATNITPNSAALNGFVDTRGNLTSIWYEWGTNSSVQNKTNVVTVNSGSNNVVNDVFNLSANTTYYFRLVAQNNYGTAQGSIMSFTTSGSGSSNNSGSPFVQTYSATGIGNNFASLNGFVDPNNNLSTTRWFEYGTNSSSLNLSSIKLNQVYVGNFSMVITNLSPNTTYYFRAVAQNPNNTVYGSVMSFTTSGVGIIGGGDNVTGGQLQSITTLATNIGKTSARLNALVIVGGNANTTGWFEWGTSTGLGNMTSTQSIGSAPSIAFFQSLFDLAQNTTYYYRAVSQNQNGISRGDILSFRTGDTTTVTPGTGSTTTTVTEVSSARTSFVTVSITQDKTTLVDGEEINYTVNYKNISSRNLKNVVLKIVLPKELDFKSSSTGVFSGNDDTLTVNVGELKAGQSGSVTLKAEVTGSIASGKAVVTTVNMIYTTDAGVQEQAIAYSIQTGGEDEGINNAAAALFTGLLPTSPSGWVLLILLIILLVLLARNLYGTYQEKKVEDATKVIK